MRCYPFYAIAAIAVFSTEVNCDTRANETAGWLRNLCASNVYAEINPIPGQIVRFNTPIPIVLNGNSQAKTALKNLEQATNHNIRFQVVNKLSGVGIVVSEGDALNAESKPGCGNVTNESGPGTFHDFSTNTDGKFNTVVYVHLV